MKKQLYIVFVLFLYSSITIGQNSTKEITPFYFYYSSFGSLGMTQTIEIKNNGIIKYRVDGVEKQSLTKTIKMDKKSFQVFKSKLVDYYKIFDLPEDLNCKKCMDGQMVKIKYEILNKTREMNADNPQSANKDYKELEKYIFDVVGTLDIN